MNLREDTEKREYEFLAPQAAKSAESRGRRVPEEKCRIRTDYQRDRDRIVHSKAFRRLMHKTQVFLAPEGDHYRTRLTHTLEVAQIARTIARTLALNEDLTEAIALGHDLGHTPFGHNGEEYLDQRHPGGFCHNVQSLRVVEHLEPRGQLRGMNLTEEVRDGILNHTGPDVPFTLEGQIVRISDRIAYINHDIDDALRGRIIGPQDLPEDCVKALGSTHRERIDTLVRDLTENSDGKDEIVMSPEALFYMNKLRSYMFENVYHSRAVKKEEDLARVKTIIVSLYDYYEGAPEKLPEEYREMEETWGLQECIKDHVAGMTDRYAVNLYSSLFPQG
ncbi:MAG: deoxyguanosinetriphosphate triphosphohydrolase [Bacillota bacterium]|nr:deoxyguanosinetriphosphate triphosphohydrolase [Bacillota bacterium]